MACSDLVVLRDGLTVSWGVVVKVLNMTDSGYTFTPRPDGKVQIQPHERLTADERHWLATHRDEVRAIVAYVHGRLDCRCAELGEPCGHCDGPDRRPA